MATPLWAVEADRMLIDWPLVCYARLAAQTTSVILLACNAPGMLHTAAYMLKLIFSSSISHASLQSLQDCKPQTSNPKMHCRIVQVGVVRLAEYLLQNGAVIEAPDPQGRTPLHYAVLFSRAGAISLLLRRGANRCAS